MLSGAEAAKTPPEVSKKGKWDLLALYMFCPVLLVGCLGVPFLQYDDYIHVANPEVLGTTPVLSIFTSRLTTYFPVTLLSYRLEHFIAVDLLQVRNWAPLVRIDNLILHMLAGLGVWFICGAFSLGRAARLFVTGAFLLHPMACESVCWVSERKNVLAGTFGFAGIAVLLNLKPGARRTLLTVFLFTMAVFSKPSALGLVPVIVVLEFWMQYQARGAREIATATGEKKSHWTYVVIALVIGAAATSLCLNLVRSAPTRVSPPGGSVFTAMLTDTEVLLRYIGNLLCPTQLSAFYYVEPITSLTDARFLINFTLLASLIAGTVWLSTRRSLAIFLWFWFVAALGPVLNLVSIPFIMQDRYVYLSSPALFGVVALAIEGAFTRVISRWKLSYRGTGLAMAGTACVLLALAGSAASRSFVWSSTFTLFQDAVEKQPRSIFAQMFLGTTMIKFADEVEAHSPENPMLPVVRAQAAEHLETACRSDELSRLISPTQPFNALSIVQIKRGKLDEAERAARYCLEPGSEPTNDPLVRAEAHKHLAQIMMARQRYEDAINESNFALDVHEPGLESEMWMLKGGAFEKLGQIGEAIASYRKVVKDSAQYGPAQVALKRLTEPHAAQNDTK